MEKKYNSKLNREMVEIFVGEYYVTRQEEIITTLLGSCVAICLMDLKNKVFGMNHFLLPDLKSKTIDSKLAPRYGDNSMKLLINRMLKMEAKRENFKAKVFGGGRVLNMASDLMKVNEDNIKFIHEFLYKENIEIVSENVGGDHGRKIYFDTKDGSVYMEKINKSKMSS